MADFDLTLIVPTYNQEAFIEDSLKAVLDQECPPTEIIISDDNSTDRTFELIERCVQSYRGPHRVRYWKNGANLGSGNLLKCAAASSQRRVVQCHGDDISRPDRAIRLFEAFEATGASLISTNATLIDTFGCAKGPLVAGKPSGFDTPEDVLKGWHRSRTGATQAFDVSLVHKFTPWNSQNYWAAGDHILPFRAALLGGAYFLDEDLILRRQHARNLGKEVGRRGDAPNVQNEVLLAHLLVTRAFMQRDLDYFVSRNGDTATCQTAKEILSSEMARLITEWSQARSDILNSGLRPSWIEQETLFENLQLTTSHVKPEFKRGSVPAMLHGLKRLVRQVATLRK